MHFWSPFSAFLFYHKHPKCNNEWQTTPNHRTIDKIGCPNCHYNYYYDNISDTELFEQAKQLNKGLPIKIVETKKQPGGTKILYCIIQDETGQIKTVSASKLKQAAEEGKIYLINYKNKIKR